MSPTPVHRQATVEFRLEHHCVYDLEPKNTYCPTVGETGAGGGGSSSWAPVHSRSWSGVHSRSTASLAAERSGFPRETIVGGPGPTVCSLSVFAIANIVIMHTERRDQGRLQTADPPRPRHYGGGVARAARGYRGRNRAGSGCLAATLFGRKFRQETYLDKLMRCSRAARARSRP